MDVREIDHTRKKKEAKGRELPIEELCLYLLFAGVGALLGSAELIFGVHPFGVALAAAAGKVFPGVALGVAAFALCTKDYLSMAALGIVALIRLGFSFYPAREGTRSTPLFGERLGFRMIAAAASVIITAAVSLFQNDFRYYYLFALLLGTLTAALAALLLSGLFMPRERLFPYSREAGLATLGLLCIFALREVSLLSIYPSAVAAALAAFWLGAHYGIAVGVVGGGLCGLCFDPVSAPAFLLCGLGFSLLEKSSRGGAILAGSAAAAAYAYAISGVTGVTALLPALLTAGALFLAGDSAGIVQGSPAERIRMLRRRGALQAARAHGAQMQSAHLKEISGALADISGILYELGGTQRRPGLLDLRHLCDREFDKVCPQCPHRDVCWGSEYTATAEAVGALGTRLHATGEVDRTRIPPALAARCRDLGSILEGINAGAERLFEEAMRGDKTSVVAMDYAAMGRMLGEALAQGEEAYCIDVATGERIAARLQRLGYVFESVSVCGRSHRSVLLRGIRLPGRHIKLRELRQVLEQHCHCLLGEAEITEQEGAQDITFGERCRFTSVTVKQTRAKGKENGYCGDSVMSFSTKGGYDYAFLCDGMGSGNRAALTSALAATVLSRFLRAGNRADTSLRILNGVLAARGQRESEASTTVDLLEIDRVSGEASLFKCGAAPTYLLRGGMTTRFFSRTAPIGILEALDAEKLRFDLEEGDVLVQVSDGITRGEEECLWLSDMLLTRWEGDAEKFARLVLNRAEEQGMDDLSVLITEIKAAPIPGTEEAAQMAG
ncbi:MAG: SpoIIE family protein phosphatase [Clostridia bacterium]|nr:SpoIIE family protein phosphatase [Clostridia bacterium]